MDPRDDLHLPLQRDPLGEAPPPGRHHVHLPRRRLRRHPMEVLIIIIICTSSVSCSSSFSSTFTFSSSYSFSPSFSSSSFPPSPSSPPPPPPPPPPRYWDAKWQQDHSYGQENVNDRLGFHHVMLSVGGATPPAPPAPPPPAPSPPAPPPPPPGVE